MELTQIILIYLFIYLFTQCQSTCTSSVFQCYQLPISSTSKCHIRPHCNPIVIKKVKIVMSAITVRYTYSLHFSASEHQKADWLGIHQKICQLLIPLRTPIPFLGSEEERHHRKQQQIVRQVQCIYTCKA